MNCAEEDEKTHSALFDMSDVMGDGLLAVASQFGAVISFVIGFLALFVWLISKPIPRVHTSGK